MRLPSHTFNRRRLRLQADLLARLRRFFEAHRFLEVQTPLLSEEVIPEEHIEPFMVAPEDAKPGPRLWLQASPEAHMKRLLAGMTADGEASAEPLAIYQITRSFRSGELGPLHRPEFTIVEWYRTGDDLAAGMDLLDELCREVTGAPASRRTSYEQAFQQYVSLDPHAATEDQLRAVLAENDIAFEHSRCEAASGDIAHAVRDDLLNLLLVKLVEPHLGEASPEILYDYPASQASLSKLRTREDGVQVAERFELYWRGVELANGFHELSDAVELRRRFHSVNAARAADGRAELPLPERFLAAMQQGLPPCTGVALGFDRLLMLSAGEASLDALA